MTGAKKYDVVDARDRQWAAFYDSLGLPYRYDRGTYSGGYFYLSYGDCWMRALPAEPHERDRHEAELLARLTNKHAFLLYGGWGLPGGDSGYRGEKWLAGGGEFDADAYWWCECPHCGMFAIEYEGRSSRLPCGCVRRVDPQDKAQNAQSDRLLRAYDAGASAVV